MARRFFREDFDRSREFVAKRDLIINGQLFSAADRTPLDKTKFTDRRLRQLYDRRMIDYSDTNPSLSRREGLVVAQRGRGRLTQAAPEIAPAKAAERSEAPPRKRRPRPLS